MTSDHKVSRNEAKLLWRTRLRWVLWLRDMAAWVVQNPSSLLFLLIILVISPFWFVAGCVFAPLTWIQEEKHWAWDAHPVWWILDWYYLPDHEPPEDLIEDEESPSNVIPLTRSAHDL